MVGLKIHSISFLLENVFVANGHVCRRFVTDRSYTNRSRTNQNAAFCRWTAWSCVNMAPIIMSQLFCKLTLPGIYESYETARHTHFCQRVKYISNIEDFKYFLIYVRYGRFIDIDIPWLSSALLFH